MLKYSSAWIADQVRQCRTQNRSRGAPASELCSPRRIKSSPSREKAEGGGAPKGACIHVRASQTSFRSLRNPSARGSGPTSGAARLPALRGGACQSDRTLRLSRAALHAKERAPALPAPSIALKRSTPHPGRRPQGTMPEPGNGVTSPARRNRTRSINRPSPMTSLERAGTMPVT